ncbi:hypothetical protein PBN151_5620 [Paenibacillus sp. NAIST15-1]|nr:hypothetical protein PBN151_5620 [Paenibacillus sp. NAIST15-1]
MLAFQFLIGTLQTMTLYIYTGSVRSGFQFLIGTLQTFIVGSFAVPYLMFQFLIGTLQTREKPAVTAFF